jgi:hypothetical protein
MSLAARKTSAIVCCDNLPHRRLHCARALSNWHSHYQSVAAKGIPLGPSTAQELLGDYFVVKMTHLLMLWTIGWPLRHPTAGPAAKDKTTMWTNPAWNMDEPIWDWREAIAKAVARAVTEAVAEAKAHHLGIQPSINRR